MFRVYDTNLKMYRLSNNYVLRLDGHLFDRSTDEEIHHFVLEQYLDVYDTKTNKPLAVGDIVHCYTKENDGFISGQIKGEIVLSGNCFCVRYKDTEGRNIYNNLWLNAENYVVIGNVHDNEA